MNAISHKTPRSTRFTLVELLVVIAIISILAGMLMPALEGAYQSARTVKCASNLKQISLALIQYCSDNDDFLPPTCVSGNYKWRYLLAEPYFGQGLYTMTRTSCVFTCPTGAAIHANCGSFEHFSGYGLNTGMAHNRTSRALVPSQTLLVGDGKWRVSGNFYENALWPNVNGTPDAVHNDGANLLYVDGHVDNQWSIDIPTECYSDKGLRFWCGL